MGQPGFGEPRFLQPVIATFARGLPHAYRAAGASEGAAVAIEIDGERWVVQRSTRGWALVAEAEVVSATISMKGDDAWRLWTKGLSADEARSRSEISGDEALVAPAFSFVAIMV